MLSKESRSTIDEYCSESDIRSNSVLTHIDSLLFYLGSEDYISGTLNSDKTCSKSFILNSLDERSRTGHDLVNQQGNISQHDHEIYIRDKNGDRSRFYQNVESKSNYKQDFHSKASSDISLAQHLEGRFGQVLSKDSIAESSSGFSRAGFNNFYQVEVSDKKYPLASVLPEGSNFRVLTTNDNINVPISRSLQFAELIPTRSAEKSTQSKKNANIYAKVVKEKTPPKNKSDKPHESRLEDCISTIVDTLGEVINKLTPSERAKTLSKLKSNTKLQSLLESPSSPDKDKSDLDYFTFNEVELSVSQLDVLPLNEIKLRSLGGQCKEETTTATTGKPHSRDGIARAYLNQQPKKSNSHIESVYQSSMTSDSHLHQISMSSNLSLTSHERTEPRILVKTRESAQIELRSNKENQIQFNRPQNLYTQSLQDKVNRQPRGYLKGSRLN